MSRRRGNPFDRSLSEPSGLREKEMLNRGASVDSSNAFSEENTFSKTDFYASYLRSLDANLKQGKDLSLWLKVNDLESHPFYGTFSGSQQEETYILSQSMYTDQPMRTFFVLYFLVFQVSLLLEYLRIGSAFDVGAQSRAFRVGNVVFMVALTIGVLIQRYRNPDYFTNMKEARRRFLATAYSSFWFLYYPPIHSSLLGIRLRDTAEYDTLVIWTFILLQLTALSSCAAFKLRFRHGFEIVGASAVQSVYIMMISDTKFNWKGIYGLQTTVSVMLFNLAILRAFDHQARARFVDAARQFEVSKRVMAMAKRLQAAQAFANLSWKSDNTVSALRRIREDPILNDEYAHRLTLDVAISTIAQSGEAASASTPDMRIYKGWFQKQSPILPEGRRKVQSPHGISQPEVPVSSLLTLPAHLRRISSLTENEGLLERDILEPLMGDWNFGATAGIWTHLNDSRLTLFSSRPLVSTMLLTLDFYGYFDPSLPLDDGTDMSGPFLDKATTLKYFAAVEASYNPRDQVPYHNALHAVDVVQSVFAITRLDSEALQGMSRLAVFALLFGAAIHDVGHPGLNNAHLKACNHELAIKYNDRSVLENFHVSHAFSLLMSSPEVSILTEIQERDKKNGTQNARLFRNLVVDMVLATDLAHHFECQARFRAKLAGKVDFNDITDTSLVCSVLLHAADVGNVAKAWNAYEPWIDLLFREFFAQGDREKRMGIPVAPFMDRDVAIPEKAQSAFITNIVLPLYQVMLDFTPVVASVAIDHMRKNLNSLDRKVREKEASSRTSPASSLDTILSQREESQPSDAESDNDSIVQ